MSGFSFKNFTFVLITANLLWFSSIEICNARGTFGSMYKKKGRDGQHEVNAQKSISRQGSKFNVLHYEAKGDGKSDDTKAFQAAWEDACKVEASTIIVPSGYKFFVWPSSFSGSNCQKNIIFQLDGTILAPTNSKAWGSGLEHWLEFTNLIGFTINGRGTFDGRGSVWWTQSTQDSFLVSSSMDGKMPRTKPMAVRIIGCSDVTVTGIMIQNSPQFHLTFDNCDDVLVYDVRISSPGDSPNTDGIHLSNSKNVIIHHTNIACGDDCISIQTGCQNILVHHVNCGPGHGISIGSLGIDGTKACVTNVTVRDTKIHNTMTGVRIKTWQGAEGFVRGVLFSNIQVSEVETPIMIDQYYCDHSSCKNQTSAVRIANIAYENIHGSYIVQPVHLSCSDSKPCMNLKLSDIELKPNPNGHKMSKSFCWQAFGKLNAPIIPKIDCLQEGDSLNRWVDNGKTCSID